MPHAFLMRAEECSPPFLSLLPRGQHHQRRKEGGRKTSFRPARLKEEECGQIPTRSACLHCVIGESLFSPAIPQLEPLSLAINYEATIIKVTRVLLRWFSQPLIVAERCKKV